MYVPLKNLTSVYLLHSAFGLSHIFHFSITGTSSLLMMVAIGYDRYNVIVKGISGFRISYGVALLIILTIWTYSTLVCIPPFLGWGGYALGKTNNLKIIFKNTYLIGNISHPQKN